ncbi:type VII secretion protein EccE [Amycolatopsis anabasis]|uniref:type VII secretion protein EccE n=1 Tax=Amycolatopsis anabasis TaxID=1840409 RepID=UPI00131CDE7C|nr:type VII secretion protein EccE [Amycolatopsis anabasis]
MSLKVPAWKVPRPLSPASAPWILPIRVSQVAGWEIAAILMLLAAGPGTLTETGRIVAVSLAALVVVTTSIRFAGRHLAAWTFIGLTYRLRQHDDRHDAGDPLHALAGEVRLREHVDRAGNRFGVAETGSGWTAVLRMTAPVNPDPEILVEALRDAYERTDIPLAGAQLVAWTMPRSDGGTPYRVHWLAVRYRPEEAPIAALARGGGDLGALRACACAALTVLGALAEAGYECTVLDAAELGEELALALGAERDSAEITDGWRSWTAGGLAQSCFLPHDTGDLSRLLTAHAPGAAFTASSFALRRTAAGKTREDVAIRVGTRTGLPAARPDVPAFPLHGRHADHVRRSLPLALP